MVYKKLGAILCSFTLITSPIMAANLGKHGPTWEVEEENLLDLIYRTLKVKEANGDVDALQKQMTESTKAYVRRPTPVAGLVKATETRSFMIDPSIEVTKDLSDHLGRIFAYKGTWINPLDYQPFRKRIVFIDGDDEAQVKFALLEGDEFNRLIVLTNGAPFELTEKYRTRFWFDQDGIMVERFNITALPSEVVVEGRLLRVTEVALDD